MCFSFLVGREKRGMEDVVYFPGGWQAEMVGEGGKYLRYFKESLSFGSELPRGIVETEVCCFQPHIISNFPRGKVPSVSFSHDSASHFMCCQGFLSDFFQGCQVVLHGRKGGLFQRWIHSGFISM